MTEIGPEVLAQLERAQADLSILAGAVDGPPVSTEVAVADGADAVFGAAGSGTSKYVLVDHYFGSSTRVLWAHVGSWYGIGVGAADEQGIAQVAFTADRVDAWWNSSSKLTIMRCWKNF